jgi:hypothetical protein
MLCYMPCPCHPPWFDHPNTMWWRVQIMKLLITFSNTLNLLSPYEREKFKENLLCNHPEIKHQIQSRGCVKCCLVRDITHPIINEYGTRVEWWLAGRNLRNSEKNLFQCHTTNLTWSWHPSLSGEKPMPNTLTMAWYNQFKTVICNAFNFRQNLEYF